jgi:hypothetical protein
VIKVEDWAEIRRLHRAEGMPIKAIARHLGVARNTVRKALAAAEPPKYERVSKGSIVDAVEPQIRVLLGEFPDMPSTVIAELDHWATEAALDPVGHCSGNGRVYYPAGPAGPLRGWHGRHGPAIPGWGTGRRGSGWLPPHHRRPASPRLRLAGPTRRLSSNRQAREV